MTRNPTITLVHFDAKKMYYEDNKEMIKSMNVTVVQLPSYYAEYYNPLDQLLQLNDISQKLRSKL